MWQSSHFQYFSSFGEVSSLDSIVHPTYDASAFGRDRRLIGQPSGSGRGNAVLDWVMLSSLTLREVRLERPDLQQCERRQTRERALAVYRVIC